MKCWTASCPRGSAHSNSRSSRKPCAIADEFLLTAAGQRNRNHTEAFVEFRHIPFAMEEILFDPQTSGGLLTAVEPVQAEALEKELRQAGLPARIIGEITNRTEPEIMVVLIVHKSSEKGTVL